MKHLLIPVLLLSAAVTPLQAKTPALATPPRPVTTWEAVDHSMSALPCLPGGVRASASLLRFQARTVQGPPRLLPRCAAAVLGRRQRPTQRRLRCRVGPPLGPEGVQRRARLRHALHHLGELRPPRRIGRLALQGPAKRQQGAGSTGQAM